MGIIKATMQCKSEDNSLGTPFANQKYIKHCKQKNTEVITRNDGGWNMQTV